MLCCFRLSITIGVTELLMFDISLRYPWQALYEMARLRLEPNEEESQIWFGGVLHPLIHSIPTLASAILGFVRGKLIACLLACLVVPSSCGTSYWQRS